MQGTILMFWNCLKGILSFRLQIVDMTVILTFIEVAGVCITTCFLLRNETALAVVSS
jgi:hypothetical protein